MSIGLVVSGILICGLNLLIHCYVSLKSTECYLKLADILYRSNWFEMPIILQKYVILSILEAQKPIFYSAYYFANFNLETIIKVIL